MMDKETIEVMMIRAADQFDWWFTPIDDSWELWSEIIDKPQDYPTEVVEIILSMDKEERLIWRMELAEKGYEMTPIQVDQYIYIMEMARDRGFV